MKIAHRKTSKRYEGFAHRPGGIRFISLLQGERRSRQNFEFTIVNSDSEYYTPQHRHNFDQVRVMLKGNFGYAKDKVQEEGTIGYFCEGTRYTQAGEDASEILLLQAAGASGSEYIGLDDLQVESARIAQEGPGKFENGVYTWLDESGKKHNQDSWEAVWEQIFERKMKYPKPRFEAPIIFNPENFAWLSTGIVGVQRRHLASFQEREIGLSQLQMAAGASCDLTADSATALLFVYSGSGEIDGQALYEHSAAQLEKGESAALTATDDMLLLRIDMSQYD